MAGDMKVRKEPQIIDLFCTPQDLRELADRMAREIKNHNCGDDNLVEYIHGKKITIAIRIDQDRI